MAGSMYFNFAQVDDHHAGLNGLSESMKDNIARLKKLNQTLEHLLGGATAGAYQDVAGNLNTLLARHEANLAELNMNIHAVAGSQGHVQTQDQAMARKMAAS